MQVDHLCGWVPHPEETEKIVAALPYPTFAEAAPDLMLMSFEEEKDAFLYKACQVLHGKNLPAHFQKDGTCVGQGWSAGVDDLQCVEIVSGERETFKTISPAAVYAFSREIAGMLGGGAGSYGGAAAKAVSQWGTVSCEDSGDKVDDDRLGTEWGRKGAPAKIKELAKDHIVKTVTLVKTAEECRAALQNGYPVPVCSNQGFSMQRDSEGYCRPQGSWAHCVLPNALIGTKELKHAENVNVGDEVVGHDGKYHKVTEKYVRDYDGDLVVMRVTGVRPVKVTSEHPVLIYRYISKQLNVTPTKEFSDHAGNLGVMVKPQRITWKKYVPMWVPAYQVKKGDYLVTPGVVENDQVELPKWIENKKCSNNPLPITESNSDLAWLFGLFIADGNTVKNHKVVITLNINESDIADRAVKVFKDVLGLKATVTKEETYQRVTVYSSVLARSFREWFKSGAKNKQIPAFLMNGWDKQALINGIQDGDGCYYKNRNIIYTTSRRLLYQIWQLLVSLGEHATMGVQGTSSGTYKNASKCWSINWLSERTKSSTKFVDNNCILPVREVTTEYYKGKVYNYEVEDVHSYIANGVVVHNCMLIEGYRKDKRWFCIRQSWGANVPSGPTTLDQPDCSFWADWDTVNKMLRGGDSFAISGYNGFPARKLPESLFMLI